MNEKPHFAWWIGHLFMGIVTGLAVYVLYKDKNPPAAKRHLIFSLVLTVVMTLVAWAAFGAILILDA